MGWAHPISLNFHLQRQGGWTNIEPTIYIQRACSLCPNFTPMLPGLLSIINSQCLLNSWLRVMPSNHLSPPTFVFPASSFQTSLPLKKWWWSSRLVSMRSWGLLAVRTYYSPITCPLCLSFHLAVSRVALYDNQWSNMLFHEFCELSKPPRGSWECIGWLTLLLMAPEGRTTETVDRLLSELN